MTIQSYREQRDSFLGPSLRAGVVGRHPRGSTRAGLTGMPPIPGPKPHRTSIGLLPATRRKKEPGGRHVSSTC